MTSDSEANWVSDQEVQVAANVLADQLELYHSPLASVSEQHWPWNSRWQFGMTAIPACTRSATRSAGRPATGTGPAGPGWRPAQPLIRRRAAASACAVVRDKRAEREREPDVIEAPRRR